MRILIIAPIFSPANRIGAIRWTKIAKYLSLQGHKVTVISSEAENTPIEDEILKCDARAVDQIVSLESRKLYPKIASAFRCVRKAIGNGNRNSNGSNIGDITQKANESGIKSKIRKWVLLYQDISFARRACKYLKKHDTKVDKIITTYGPFSGHLVGKYYKKKHPSVKWIADFRDSVQYIGEKNELGGFARRFLRNTQKKADLMIAISEGLAKELTDNSKYQCVLVTNGYDPDDFQFVKKANYEKGNSLNLCYSGSFFPNCEDLAPLFCVIRELIDEGKVPETEIQFHYAGRTSDDVIAVCKQYQLGSILVDHGSLPRVEALRLQSRSDVLVVACWNTQEQQGILTGKFLEYMMHKKPIIALVTGNRKNSETKKIMEQNNLGICYEEANRQEDFDRLKKFILMAYASAKQETAVLPQPDYGFTSRYDYKAISKEVEQLLLQ